MNKPPALIYAQVRPRRRQPFSLGHIMIALVYFAIVFWVAWVFQVDREIRIISLAVVVGLGLTFVGFLLAIRWNRYSFLGWIVFVIGYMAVTTAILGYFAIPSFPALIGALVYILLQRRSAYQDALLGVMSVAAERRMPLTPGILAFSQQSTGIFQVWSRSLASLLDGGESFSEAIDSVPKAVPKEAPILIRMGQESGQLAAGLREAAGLRSRQDPVLQGFGSRIFYLCWVLYVGEGIIWYLLDRVFPRIGAIFEDFQIPMPAITQIVLRLSRVVVNQGALGMVAQLIVLLYLIFVFIGWGNMNVPLIDRLFRRRHTVLILRALALVVEAGRPIGPALQSLARHYPTGWVRRKLDAASAYASQGFDWVLAMHATGLFSTSDVGVLESARRAGNLSWALRELAVTSERRFGYQLQIWSQILFVLVMLVIGTLALFIALAYFLPLTTLISRLAE